MLYNLFENRDFVSVFAVALLAEGVDRNSKNWMQSITRCTSPSSRRAWIEIKALDAGVYRTQVALLAEGVDRNPKRLSVRPVSFLVALLAEGVDRNFFYPCNWLEN